jgi:hypothetical protein
VRFVAIFRLLKIANIRLCVMLLSTEDSSYQIVVILLSTEENSYQIVYIQIIISYGVRLVNRTLSVY